MNVSRPSIREGLRVLESMGVIESIHGGGNFICINQEKSLLQPLSMMFTLNNGKYQDILELRRVLEVENARLAANRATEQDYNELKNILDKMKKETYGEGSNEILVQLDKDFHNKLSSISKNCLIESLFNTTSMLFEKFIEDARAYIIQKDLGNKLLFEQHKMICNAILDKDEKKAVEAMMNHMNYVEENFAK